MKRCDRFSSAGLAGSFVDDLKLKGIVARFVFAPRSQCDSQPFVVRWEDPVVQDNEPQEEEPQSRWMAA